LQDAPQVGQFHFGSLWCFNAEISIRFSPRFNNYFGRTSDKSKNASRAACGKSGDKRRGAEELFNAWNRFMPDQSGRRAADARANAKGLNLTLAPSFADQCFALSRFSSKNICFSKARQQYSYSA